jgi:hypothetical protein
MFSGMGNGCTFPVETVIFYALAKATAESEGLDNPILSVYGDDVIVDASVAQKVMDVFAHAGFKPNRGKSFIDGPFRESCGADFFLGVDVRPVFCKELLTPERLFTLHNGFVRRGSPELAKMVINWIHPSLLLWGPDGYGDGHLISEDWGAFARPWRRSRGYEGLIFDTFATSAKRHWEWHPGDYILPQYSVYASGRAEVQIPLPHGRNQSEYLFVARYKAGHGQVVDGNQIPFTKDSDLTEDRRSYRFGPVILNDDGVAREGEAKATTFPGVSAYRKIAIYTLQRP